MDKAIRLFIRAFYPVISIIIKAAESGLTKTDVNILRYKNNPDLLYEDWGVSKEKASAVAYFFKVKAKVLIVVYVAFLLSPLFVATFFYEGHSSVYGLLHAIYLPIVVMAFLPTIFIAIRLFWKAACLESGRYIPVFVWRDDSEILVC